MRLPITGAYAPDQPAIHDRVRAEAGHRCIRCGHPAEGIKARRPCEPRCTHLDDGKPRVLTVHHLDGNKSNNVWWNLLALCQVCHLTIQAKVIPDRPYLWEHTPWFRPYVAGYYAACAGFALTRAEIEAQLEYWLNVGQPWRAEGGAA
ncbi:MAG: HNH endonuclease signature motif containing protein [Vicinamibacterales bacterium]